MQIIARRGQNIYMLALNDKTNCYIISRGKVSQKQPIDVAWKWGYWEEFMLSATKTKEFLKILKVDKMVN